MSASARRTLPTRMTIDEFLAWSGSEPGPGWELVDGTPRAMAPASATHGIIQSRIASRLTTHLDARGSPCVVVSEPAVVPRVRARNNMRVPDLVVTCTPIEAEQFAVPDPVLVIEILSPSNEAETWDNIWAYASIPSVREILILHSTKIAGELLRRRADASWPEEPTGIGPDDILTLTSVDLACPLADLYARTHLARG
jgi:Uma2 family endonuclease